MNRPFSAFVALLVLLASAMLAVSSADRSTTIRPALKAPVAATTGRGAVYVLVLPAADDDFVDVDAPELPSYAAGCGLDRTTGELYGCELYLESAEPASAVAAGTCFVSAAIELAEDDAAGLGPAEPMDCLAHHDPDYDRIVYNAARVAAESATSLPAVRWSEVEFERLLSLFEAIAGAELQPESECPATTTSAAPAVDLQAGQLPAGWRPATERLASNARTLWLGLKNRTLRLADEAAEAGDAPAVPMEWDEYAELIDEVAPANSASREASDVKVESVRSSGWMRHFAASSLHHAGLWLQNAALQLDDAAPAWEARQTTSAAR